MLTSRIYHWADRTPDQVAVLHDAHPISYGEFASYLGRSRGYFLRRGVAGPGLAVLLTARLMDFWILSLALRSLGFDTILARAPEDIEALHLPEVSLVATTDFDMTEALPSFCAARGWPLLHVVLDGEPDLPLGEGSVVARQGGHILTTSGTTGAYKKVLMDPAFEPEFFRIRRDLAGVTARSVVNILNFNPSTGVGYKSPASTWDIGGTVLIHQAPEPHRSLFHPGVTHVTLTPHLVRAIVALPAEAFPPGLAPRVQISGGAVSQAAIDAIKARLGPNIYSAISSTETSTFTLTRLDTPDDRRWHRPAPGRRLQVVDGADKPAPLGEIGLIRVSTQGGPTGYLHDAEATRAFFKDGFFYPGDLAIMRADGRIALQGRATEVLNIGGDKIAPAPIEERMEAELGVSGVCLFTMQNEDAEEEAHAVIESLTGLDEARIVAALPKAFASFSQFHYHIVESLPRNAMGKLLRGQVRQRILALRQAQRPR